MRDMSALLTFFKTHKQKLFPWRMNSRLKESYSCRSHKEASEGNGYSNALFDIVGDLLLLQKRPPLIQQNLLWPRLNNLREGEV